MKAAESEDLRNRVELAELSPVARSTLPADYLQVVDRLRAGAPEPRRGRRSRPVPAPSTVGASVARGGAAPGVCSAEYAAWERAETSWAWYKTPGAFEEWVEAHEGWPDPTLDYGWPSLYW